MMNNSFEYVQSLCDTINDQSKIIERLNKNNRELHQILAMHGIEFMKEEKENEKYEYDL